MRIQRNAGTPSVGSSKSISFTGLIMKNPTRSNAGAVAALGIDKKRGERNRESKNIIAVTIAVTPVLPPSTTPVLDSTNVVTVDVPSIAPTVVPTASAKRACLQLGIVSVSFNQPAFVAQPIRVPTVSNISTNKKVNITMRKSAKCAPTSAKLNFINVGARLGGIEANPPNCVTPIGIPMIVVTIIPIRMFPFTLYATRTAVMTRPIRARIAVLLEMFKPTRVDPLSTMIPAFWRPMNATNIPIPTLIAFLRLAGIELTIASRTLNAVRRIKIIPSQKIAVKANCQL